MYSFNDKIVVVTGANRGIGLACVRYFLDRDASVVCCVRNIKKSPIITITKENRNRILLIKCDVRKEEDIKIATRKISKKYGRVDILINNAGVDQPMPILKITEKHWDYIIETNLTGLVFMTKYIGKLMAKRKSGCIINLSSIAGKEGSLYHSAYVASKHAVIGFTKCVARELIPYSIRVNAVCPGLIDTDMLHGFFKSYSRLRKTTWNNELKKMIESTPRGRVGSPMDVANLIGFLCSDEAVNIIGGTINTDGGMLQH